MFRNPRENAALKPSETLLPSRGRPPTPPQDGRTQLFSSPTNAHQPPMSRLQPSVVSPTTPILGRQSSKPASGKRNGFKQNQSILSFFGKTEKVDRVQNEANLGLFFDDGTGGHVNNISPEKQSSSYSASAQSFEEDSFRFNEDLTPIKRRRLGTVDNDGFLRTPSPERTIISPEKSQQVPTGAKDINMRKSRGGFVDDSSDDEGDCTPGVLDAEELPSEIRNGFDATAPSKTVTAALDLGSTAPVTTSEPSDLVAVQTHTTSIPLKSEQDIPTLTRENTSIAPADFDDEDFEHDEFYEEGEEFLERRWLEEQQELDIGLDDDSKSESGTDGITTPSAVEQEITPQTAGAENIASCPICNGSMKGLSEVEASTHVNACLDGTAKPLPVPAVAKPVAIKREPSAGTNFSGPARRFQRAAIARPAQANPFSMAAGTKIGGTAFTKLMSGHAEDAAWAEAAANEASSRGKPAYQRTCPFYKIMPGLYICVDAFRFGKVEGQNAYFLSHFHSDHYGGLTAQWCHGPIYASKVSCNLMRQQLRVESKWLRPLEFEKRTEVPDTDGVFVTMIPANHCPGSSLFLFEKVIGKQKDGSPKLNRILHCGDFRACPAHVNHPLLMPDVMDAVSGQVKQQIIDTCYLDTTYLTPKYAFPSQSDVIEACAQMCVSMSKEVVDSSDSWEQVKLAKAGSAMKKFLEDGKSEVIKTEEQVEEQKPKIRGRLLVVIGTYSIGKERICLGIARALKSKIYAPPAKMRICKALEDDDLNSLLTSDPLEAQVHMQTLMEIRAETLHDYLITFKGHFHRVVGFRPTGWTYRPPSSRFTDNPSVNTVLTAEGWKSRFSMHDLAPQRGSTKESNCFGVPYSEHSSFRELTMFCCALRINRIIPTVNVGNARSRERMKSWIEKWEAEKRKNGLFKIEVNAEGWGSGDGQLRYGV